ncbi:MAG: hypothetical protein ACSHXW_15695 [Yoonia sp.]
MVIEKIKTSNIRQEMLPALRGINTAFSMIDYPILVKSDDLLKSRLAYENGARLTGWSFSSNGY